MEDAALARSRSRRPAGWQVPGPLPLGAQGRPELSPAEDEDLSFLTGDFRIFQKKRGHRWSLDDFATAWIALRAASALGQPASFCDLGCGIGSVLMMMAWAFPGARGVGVEAQELSFGLLRRSLAYNGLEERVQVEQGDLREPTPLRRAASFDLVTGTPPYIPLGSGLVSPKDHRRPAFFETRGGLEDYCAEAARLLLPGGVFAVCAGVHPKDRGQRAAAAAGLHVAEQIDVVPRAGKPTLFRVFVMRRGVASRPPELGAFVVRDADGKVSAQMHEARRDLGQPPLT